MASIIIACLIIIAVYVGTKRLSGLQTIAVIFVTLAGIVLAIFPGLSSEVAGALHVGRGTDLIFYIAVLAGLFIASNFYFRFKRHEEALIELTRQSALDHARRPAEPDTSAPHGDGTVEEVQKDFHRVES